MAERSSPLDLPEELSLADLPALRKTMAARLAKGALHIRDTHARESGGADTAALQLIVSALCTGARQGRKVTVELPEGGALSAVMARLGLDDPADAMLHRDGDRLTGIDLSGEAA